MDLFDKCAEFLDARSARASGFYPYFHPIEAALGTEVVLGGKRCLSVGTNDYLGLASDVRVKEAASAAVRRFGSSYSGSRLLNGTCTMHEALEEELARFLKKEAAVVFATGYQTNLGTLSALLGPRDVVFADRRDHASIFDGIRLGQGQLKRFRHNDLEDLESLMAASDSAPGKLVVVDGVYGMEGDMPDLPALAALKRHGARLMVDDSHGVGVLGAYGRGSCEYQGIEDHVDLIVCSFSKSLASIGGVVAGPAEVIDFIKHRSRSLIFSASAAPAALGACLMALNIVQSEPQRRERLQAIAHGMRTALQALGFEVGSGEAPVIPIIIGDDQKTFEFWHRLKEAGVYANAVVRPAVAPGMQLIRTSYTAAHTDSQLDRVLKVFEGVGRKMGMLGSASPRATAR